MELSRYDQIQSYEPYYENATSNDGKKYSEVGLVLKLNCSRPKFGEAAGSVTGKGARNFHPYVHEIKVPTAKNVDSFSHVGLKDHLDKIFGTYEDNSVVGGIKSSFVGTNKERQQMKVATEGIKALGNLAKAKITGNEEDAEDYATGNRVSLGKVANSVEDKILGENGLLPK